MGHMELDDYALMQKTMLVRMNALRRLKVKTIQIPSLAWE